MVPHFEKFLYSSLSAFKNGNNLTISEVCEYNKKYHKLSKDDCEELTRNGTKSKVQDRTAFSITYLYQAQLLERVSRGLYKISEEGTKLLDSDVTEITREYMEQQYPAFYEFSRVRKKEHSASDKTKPTKPKNKKGKEDDGEFSPMEQMQNNYDILSAGVAKELLDEVKKKSPKFFEHLVVKLLVAMGYGGSEEDALVTKQSHDDGIDGIIKEDKLGLDSIYIQAKRYTQGPVPKPDMQKFIGALSEQGATKGIFITTSTFANGAIETCKKSPHVKIILIDGELLAEYMIKYNVGVSTRQVFEIKKVDTDFFVEEE